MAYSNIQISNKTIAYNLIGKLVMATGLTRKTIVEILKGINLKPSNAIESTKSLYDLVVLDSMGIGNFFVSFSLFFLLFQK